MARGPITEADIEAAYVAELKRAEDDWIWGRVDLPSARLDAYMTARAERVAERLRKRQTRESWPVIRRRIYLRDNGECGVCGRELPPDGWECGHIIDRAAGGSDLDDNLMVMCWLCNQFKPMTETREEFEAWRQSHPSEIRNRIYASLTLEE